MHYRHKQTKQTIEAQASDGYDDLPGWERIDGPATADLDVPPTDDDIVVEPWPADPIDPPDRDLAAGT